MNRMLAWGDLSAAMARLYVGGPRSRLSAGPGWSAMLSGTDNGELNVCCATAAASARDAEEMLGVIEDLPVIVFTDSSAGEFRDALVAAGFSVAETSEPLMSCASVPPEAPGPFSIERVATPADLDDALTLTAQAHRIEQTLLEQTIGLATRSWRASIWLARNGHGAPVSTVALVRTRSTLVVSEMMTPPQFQRLGAGRALLSTALARSWDDDVTHALLLSTPAGRRLYESMGFVCLDESITCYRGVDDDVLAAIGQ